MRIVIYPHTQAHQSDTVMQKLLLPGVHCCPFPMQELMLMAPARNDGIMDHESWSGMLKVTVRPDQINVLVVGFPDPNYPESEFELKKYF